MTAATAWTRGLTIIHNGELYVEECCHCGIMFAIPQALEQRARKDQAIWFYCPNGHHQHYSGKTAEQKATERAKRAEARATALTDQLEASERSKSALKGVVTRTKKRIGKGVCPCCNRHFTNVERHMHSQHPDYSA